MSAQDPAGDIYPRIESITDSFGRRIESATVNGEIAGAVRDSGVLLHPGDTITFNCLGTDPQGRDLAWKLVPNHRTQSAVEVVGASGAPVTLAWSVDDDDVKETATVGVYMSGHDTQYHRFGSFDHRAYLTYRIRAHRSPESG